MIITGGATIWARQTIGSDIFSSKPAEWFKIWFYLINGVNHENNKLFKRGEGFFTYRRIFTECRSTPRQVKGCLEYLRKANMIATRRTTRGLVICILKYNLYQNLINYKSQSKSHAESQLKANQKPIKSHTIYKNDKNDKNVKKNGNDNGTSFKTLMTNYLNGDKTIKPYYKDMLLVESPKGSGIMGFWIDGAFSDYGGLNKEIEWC